MQQIWIKEMNESEPSMKRRDVLKDVKTRHSSLSWDKSRGILITDLDGVRRTDGMNLIWALAENVRTCLVVFEGKVRAEELRRTKVLRLQGRGGATRSSVEPWETRWSEGVASHSFAKCTNCSAGGVR